MLSFVLRKGVRAAITVLLLATFTFFILRLTADPAAVMVGLEAPPEALEAFRQRWGLDRSLFEQYVAYLNDLASGNFGRSFVGDRSAWEVVAERLPTTLLLMGVTALVTFAIGIPLGIVAALRRDSWVDRLAISTSVAGLSLPNYVVGLLLILLFGVSLGLLPTSGNATPWHLILPVATMATGDAAVFARFARSAMLDVLNQPFMRTASAKGHARPGAVLWHALPNAMIPLVTVVGLYVGRLIVGAVVTENVFAWPGVGSLLVMSVQNRDLAVVQTIVILVGVTMVATNLAIDFAYRWLDPRIAGEEG
ncbi:MAG: ABC transporter permease [Hyphomicrobiales bacterium]|nr:ABC transporter permease [Hyphomicrobiales bacterium]